MNSSSIDLLTEAVRTPSVNPAHGGATEMVGEGRMADWLEARLRERGLAVERLHPLGPDRPAVVGRNAPEHPVRSLMIEAHLDTVGVEGMTVDPFGAEIRGERLYGRGSCDMKGATCAFLAALTRERVRTLTERNVQLMVVGSPDEETGLTGATRLAAEGLRADDAVILEPTRCRPVIAHKGAYWYEVELRGRSGHGSRPASGISTNAALARFLPELLAGHAKRAAAHSHPLLGDSTLNLGRIEGGLAFNVIPDQTRLQLDRRVVPGEDPDEFEAGVREVLDRMIAEGRLTGGSVRLLRPIPPFTCPPDAPLARRLRRAIREAVDGDAEPEGTSWMSDAAPFSRVCDQTVVFGPGDIAQAHTVDEYISVASLREGEQIFAAFLDAYGTE